jgi:hypothetical protein
MDNLSEKMRERLDKWRKNTQPVKSAESVRGPAPSRRSGKGDYGDAMSQEDWDLEVRKSQNRR